MNKEINKRNKGNQTVNVLRSKALFVFCFAAVALPFFVASGGPFKQNAHAHEATKARVRGASFEYTYVRVVMLRQKASNYLYMDTDATDVLQIPWTCCDVMQTYARDTEKLPNEEDAS